ncbi:hypothetical protein B0A52_07414 [Exophiala mesophila]|uniref:Uncharacterized protein n=1 Tax=Exophiala mesophila TaxID=212818 RepID=A0A438MXE2_EXOME|nr:hypothetical protein B0A52_07414 [Exophiala mesophila]
MLSSGRLQYPDHTHVHPPPPPMHQSIFVLALRANLDSHPYLTTVLSVADSAVL